MKHWALVLSLVIVQVCQAESIEARGQGSSYNQALTQAQANAIRQARGSYIDNKIVIENNRLDQRSLEHFRANIVKQRVISHEVQDGIHRIVIQVELADTSAQSGYQGSGGSELVVDGASIDAHIANRGPSNRETLDQVLNDPNKWQIQLDEVKIVSKDTDGNVIVDLHYQIHWDKNYIDRLRSLVGLDQAKLTKTIEGRTAVSEMINTVSLAAAKSDKPGTSAFGIIIQSSNRRNSGTADHKEKIKICFAKNQGWNQADQFPDECIDLSYDWRQLAWPRDTCQEGEGRAFLLFDRRCQMIAFDFVKHNGSTHTVYYSLKINDWEPRRDGRVNQYYHLGHGMEKWYPGFFGRSMQGNRETIVVNYQQKQTVVTRLALNPQQLQELSRVKVRPIVVDQ